MNLDQRRVFIAHAQEQFPIVSMLASDLESSGCKCWYYEHHSHAGQSYLVQIHQAICECDVVIVLVSSKSIESKHVTREIEIAYSKDKPCLPIYVDVSATQMENRQPLWATVFGTAVHINMTGAHIQAVLDKIEDAIVTLTKNRHEKQPLRRGSRKIQLKSTPNWAADASLIDPEDISLLVTRTEIVNEYLKSNQKLFVCGSKGVGKTLLLKYKRHQMTSNERSSALLIPVDRPYLDMMTDLPNLTKSHINFLSELRHAKRLWAFSIRLSVISHFKQLADEVLRLGRSQVTDQMQYWLQRSPVEPSVVFKHMLNRQVSSINSVIDKLDWVLDHAVRNINQSACVFIDKVDQGINCLPKEAWCSVQCGLLEASWDFSSTNAHLKVFGSIREEAFANYQSVIKANVQSCLVRLQYSRADLRKVIDSLTSTYEGVPEFSEFVGLSTVRNTRADIVEESFEYLSRHSVGRPRDLVHMCSSLSEFPETLTESRFRKIVNDESANNVVGNLFEEMSAFLNCLKDTDERSKFFELLPYNLLLTDEIASILTKLEMEGITSNPFLELWNCGLLGIIEENNVGQSDGCIQSFKQASEPFRFTSRALPASRYYLLHPSLQMLVKRQRGNDGYSVFRFVIVGQECSWHQRDEQLIDIQRMLFNRPKQDPIRVMVEEILPYIHACLSENRSIDHYLPKSRREQFEERFSKVATQDLELWDCVRRAWGSWPSSHGLRQDVDTTSANVQSTLDSPLRVDARSE
ncbi:MAG: toll/interleukin-1 receptor domain-containing protein [Pirellulales bacterium]